MKLARTIRNAKYFSLFERLKRRWLHFRYNINTSKKTDYNKRTFLIVQSLVSENETPGFINSKLFDRFKSTIRRAIGFPVFYNVNGVEETKYNKRALLIYLVRAFLFTGDEPNLRQHHNLKQCIQIAAILGKFGYIVDVVDRMDMEFSPSRNYDIIIGERLDLRDADPFFKNVALKIYLATTLCHNLHNRNLRRRHELQYERRKCRIAIRRMYLRELPDIDDADAIIGFGNGVTMQTWGEAFKVPTYPFNNYGFKETEFLPDTKDYSIARKNFLFFASWSQVLKGLDLLLEIFPGHPDLNLYICGRYEKEEDFCACYQKELYETPNIHPMGWITVNSPEYNELVRKCAYIIHPSCSEGQSGSVVQCMSSGLIPLVTTETGIDTEHFGVTFSDDSLEEIERVILDVSQKPESWHREHSKRAREVSEKEYSEDAFMDRLNEIFIEILNPAEAGK